MPDGVATNPDQPMPIIRSGRQQLTGADSVKVVGGEEQPAPIPPAKTDDSVIKPIPPAKPGEPQPTPAKPPIPELPKVPIPEVPKSGSPAAAPILRHTRRCSWQLTRRSRLPIRTRS
jgi:hypothetical protein